MPPRKSAAKPRGSVAAAATTGTTRRDISPLALVVRARNKSPVVERIIVGNSLIGNPLDLRGASLARVPRIMRPTGQGRSAAECLPEVVPQLPKRARVKKERSRPS